MLRVVVWFGIRNHVTIERWFQSAVVGTFTLEGVECELVAHLSLGREGEAHVLEHFLGGFALESSFNGCHFRLRGNCTYHATACGLRVEHVANGLLNDFRFFGVALLGLFHLDRQFSEFGQFAAQFAHVEGGPEFKVGATSEELLNVFRVGHTRHFHHDLSELSLTTKDLDVWLSHTILVNTRADDFVGIVDSACHFRLDEFLHFLISALVSDTVASQLFSKDGTELVFTVGLLIAGSKDVDKVTACA